MSFDLSKETQSGADIATVALHNTERLLHAPPTEAKDSSTDIAKGHATIVAALEHLDDMQLRAASPESIARIELTQAVLWQSYADLARLQLLHAAVIDRSGPKLAVIIDDETRHTCMHYVREATKACGVAISDPCQHNPVALHALEYLRHRTLGIAELASALSTPSFNQATRQWSRARWQLERARWELADSNLLNAPIVSDPKLSQAAKKERQITLNTNQDPALKALLRIVDDAEGGRRDYTHTPPPPNQPRSILSYAGLKLRRPKPIKSHLLEHPAFSAPAPFKASRILKL